MNNTIRIIISGGIATVIQGIAELNPVSIVGFLVFFSIFMFISFSIRYFFPLKQIEKKEVSPKIKLLKERFFKTIKIIFVIFLSYIFLNSIINLVSYKLGLFNGDLTFTYKQNKALSINNKYKKIDMFESYKIPHHLLKYNGKYYLLKTKDEYLKKSYILKVARIKPVPTTLYDYLRERDDFQDILDNISPVAYEEISIASMIFNSLWFINYNTKNNYWRDFDKKYTQEEYTEYLKEKIEKEKYQVLLIDSKKQSTLQLANTIVKHFKAIIKKHFEANSDIKDIKDIKHIVELFDEYNLRPKNQREATNINISYHQISLMSYIYITRYKYELNEILSKYGYYGVYYSLSFLDSIEKTTYIGLLKSPKEKYKLSNDTVKNKANKYISYIKDYEINSKDDKVIINMKNKEPIILENLSKNDAIQIAKSLNRMITMLYSKEKEYNYANKK
jgi:hypothetical protein